MKPQMIVITLGAVAGIFAGRELDAGAMGTVGLVIVGMFAALFIFRFLRKRTNA